MWGTAEARILEPGSWSPVSQLPLEGESKIALGWENLSSAMPPPQRAATCGSLRSGLCVLVPFVICTIGQKMGLLTLESRARGSFPSLNWRKIRPTRAPRNLPPPCSSPYSAHTCPLPWPGAVFLQCGKYGTQLTFDHHPWPCLNYCVARVSLTDPPPQVSPLTHLAANGRFQQWYHLYRDIAA